MIKRYNYDLKHVDKLYSHPIILCTACYQHSIVCDGQFGTSAAVPARNGFLRTSFRFIIEPMHRRNIAMRKIITSTNKPMNLLSNEDIDILIMKLR